MDLKQFYNVRLKAGLKARASLSTNAYLNFLRWAFRVLPRGFLHGLTRMLFAFAYLFMNKVRRICYKNLCSYYGDRKSEKEINAMAKVCLKNVGLNMLDLLYYVEHPDELSRIVHFHHEDRLAAALAKGKGIIAVTAHLGNFPLLFVSLVRRGYKVNVIIRPMRDKAFSDFMYSLCDVWGINMIQTIPRKKFIRDTLGCLKKNELLFILLDEVVERDSGVTVDFLGQKVVRATGPLMYHQRLGSPVLPVFVTKDKEGHIHIHVEEEVPIEGDPSEDGYQQANISSVTRVIERYVQRYPMQWGGWLSKRWVQHHRTLASTSQET